MISRDARRNRRGQMPLALVAVLLLAGCSFFGIIYSDIGRSADNAEAMGDEMASLDEAVEDAEFGIETALGLLLTDVSSEAEGNLADRAAAFRLAAERYFEEAYPMHKGGVTTELVSEDVHLVLETLRPGDGDEVFTGGDAMASYLRAEGQVALRFTTQSASAERTLDISADAASGLPLAIGAATSFELATGGSVSMLTQMMEYQLSSLAQTSPKRMSSLRCANSPAMPPSTLCPALCFILPPSRGSGRRASPSRNHRMRRRFRLRAGHCSPLV